MWLLSPDSVARLAERANLPPDVAAYAVPAAVVALGFAAGVALEWLVVKVVPALASKSDTRLDDALASAVRGPIKVFATLTAACVAALLTPAPAPVHAWAERLLLILLIAGGVVIGARVVGALLALYGERAHLVGSTKALIRRLATISIYLVGALFVLDVQGIAITPLLTTLGLAGLAVALALQDTLSNFFAGIHVQADRPLDVGHYVRFEDINVEGFVEEVGWRTTKIRTLPNNIVVIPNSRVASSVVTDYNLPEPRMSLLVRVPFPRGVDTRRAETIIVDEAARAAKSVPGLLAHPEPFARFIPGFTEWGFEFTLIVQVETFVDQYLAQHELRHRLAERLRREGIDLPFPIRAVRLEGPGGDGAGVTIRPAEPKKAQ